MFLVSDLYCTLEVDSYGYFVSKAKTRVFRDTTEPQWNEVRQQPSLSLHIGQCNSNNTLIIGHRIGHYQARLPLVCLNPLPHLPLPPVTQEFEIELEGSQCLRILCYEQCYDKTKLNKDDNEIVDKIMGKGQVQVRRGGRPRHGTTPQHGGFLHGTLTVPVKPRAYISLSLSPLCSSRTTTV